MMQFGFSIIYIDKDHKLKHKKIQSYSAPEARYTWEEQHPDTIVLSAGLGTVNKEAWAALKKHEAEIVQANLSENNSEAL